MNAPVGETLSDEDQARAGCYALISRLFYAPPDVELLKWLAPVGRQSDRQKRFEAQADAEADQSDYARAFRALQDVAGKGSEDTLREEYDELFVGTGKARVTPYTSRYAYPQAPDHHLVALRERISGWRLGRRAAAFEIEDHVSAVCDVMRWLIEREHAVVEQRSFFDDFVYTGVGSFCDAVEVSTSTSFYPAVARLARAFLVVERAVFDLHSAE